MDDLQYKWKRIYYCNIKGIKVLNLVINGWPSIPLPKGWMSYLC